MMTKIGLFYGSTADTTAEAADHIKQAFDAFQEGIVEIHDIATCDLEMMYDYEKLIIGVPTYNIGELQDDWYFAFDDLSNLVLTGMQVAIYGLGDQYGYPDSFQDAIGILGRRLRDDCGAELVGSWPIDGYDFEESAGVENGKFMGLALDEDGQAELTEQRIQAWVKQLISEFMLKPDAVLS
jgi:flavodoxin I